MEVTVHQEEDMDLDMTIMRIVVAAAAVEEVEKRSFGALSVWQHSFGLVLECLWL